MRVSLWLLTTMLLWIASCSVAPRAGRASPPPPLPAAILSPVAAQVSRPLAVELPDRVGSRPAAGPDAARETMWSRLPDWHREWTRSGRPPEGLTEGIALARERRSALLELIRTDPRAALARRLSWRMRAGLPPEVLALVEDPVIGNARLMAKVRRDDAGTAVVPVLAFEDGGTLLHHTYGRRLGMLSKRPVPVWGIALDGEAAIDERPGRALEPDEPLDGRELVAGDCPISGLAVVADAGSPALVLGKTVRFLCSAGHIRAADEAAAAAEPLALDLPVPSSSTEGTKTLLYILATFSGQTTSIPSLGSAQACISGVNAWFQEVSYGKFQGFDATYIAVTLPKSAADYGSNDGAVLTDAAAAAQALGQDKSLFDHYVVRYNGGPGGFSGQAYVGAPGTWLKTDSQGVAAHEFGHNLGLWHANYWNATGDSVIGSGANQEYGNTFDTMGSASAGARHFNAGSKRVLDWLTDPDIHTLSSSANVRLYALDESTILGSGRKQGLRINLPRKLGSYTFSSNYWVEYRRLFTANQWQSNGVTVKLNSIGNNDEGDQLLDTTPGTTSGKDDHQVTFGRTFSDRLSGIHITPIGFGGTTPPSIDLQVNIGDFPGNRPPTITLLGGPTNLATGVVGTFSVSASDADGDALAWHWDFADGSLSSNAATVNKSWSSARVYPVLVTVSDMKGGTASKLLAVTVGSPSTFTISGQVRDAAFNPVPGVRVHNGLSGSAYRGATTDSDGNYLIGNIAAGSVTLSAVKTGYTTFVASPANPVNVVTSVSGRHFTCVALPSVTLAAVDASAAEGGADTGRWRLTRSGPTTASLAVNYALSGSASAGDYSLAGGSTTLATIAAGASSVDVTLTATADAQAESVETVVLSLAESANYVALAPAAATVTIAGLPPPVNDAFAARVGLSGSSVSTTGSNIGATREAGEPMHWVTSETASVWWTWTASSGGSVTINLAGSSFDTVLAVYTGNVLGSLAKVASNDDSSGTTSRVVFPVSNGTTYQIAVASYGTGGGSIALSLVHTATGGGGLAPTMSAISDQSITEDAVCGPLPFTIADADTALSALVLSASSSNSALLPVPGIEFAGTGGNRTVKLTPVLNQAGTATVTLTVSDGSQSATRTFVLTVAAVDDPPTLSVLPDLAGAVGQTLGPINVTVADVEKPAGDLVLTAVSSNQAVVANAGILIGGSGTVRTMTFTPVAGQSGSTVMTVTVSDGGLFTTRNLTMVVGSGGGSASGGGGGGGGGGCGAGAGVGVLLLGLFCLFCRRRDLTRAASPPN